MCINEEALKHTGVYNLYNYNNNSNNNIFVQDLHPIYMHKKENVNLH